ncbi:MAG TPA: GAF domain-containing protein [Ktedonobacteraceae bacterium]|nr:GAF domain-containing protein [Ktedonobacteraceae bacterium]
MDQSQDPGATLAQAQATIARQMDEIKALRRHLEREHFAQELQQLLTNSTVASIILSPFTHAHLLEMVVQTAAEVISAESGSLFLLDETSNDLIFKVAIGPAAPSVKQYHVPLGHGIAGMVALSGQPMIIANADQDQRLAFDIASAVNYIPTSLLCVPLFYDSHIIGALELLNKREQTTFTPKDMETLGLFANIAAFAIAQSQAYNHQNALLYRLLVSFQEIDPAHREELYHQASAFLSEAEREGSAHARACELARIVHELLLFGEQECEMCVSILQSFVQSLRNRRGMLALNA